MPVQEYFLPQTLDEALGLLDEYGPSLLVMAGGTLAMPLINDGVSMPERVMGLRHAGLDGFGRQNGTATMGATTTLTTMLRQDDIPFLQQAAHAVGGWAIRNMGTVGGNLFAPPPAGDFAVALLALDAEVTLASSRGTRTLPLWEFYTGFMTTALEPGELLTGVTVTAPTGKTAYLKYGRKNDNTPAVVTVAAQVMLKKGKVEDARLALNGVGPYPFRAVDAEDALVGSALTDNSIAAAAEAAMATAEPFSDAIASDWYRRKMTGVMVKRALAQIAQ